MKRSSLKNIRRQAPTAVWRIKYLLLPGAGGFTLLEVMAAVAIIAIALVPLLRSQTQSIRAAGMSQNLTMATLLARILMTDIETEAFPEVGELSGDFEDFGFPQFSYSVEVVNYDYISQLLESVGFAAIYDFIREVRVTIRWGEEERFETRESQTDQLVFTAIIINNQLTSLLFPGGGGSGGLPGGSQPSGFGGTQGGRR